MAERLSYPYIPGKRGFPLEEMAIPGNSGACKTASGREIEYEFKPDFVKVADPDGDRRLVAQVIGGRLLLGLYTITDGILFSKRHPDFFAGDFTRFVIHDYFPDNGTEIDDFLGHWRLGSDNYYQFVQAQRKGADAATAARSTWSGKIMQENGFPYINNSDVATAETEIFPGRFVPYVTARFHRTPERAARAARRAAAIETSK